MPEFDLLLPLLWSWLEFAIRWTHVITAIAWIGSSFYFIALDLGLRKAADLPPGAHGEEWQVHGGGFYHIRKLSGRARFHARTSDLVQMGELFHLDHRSGPVDGDVLGRGRAVPH